MLLVEAANRAKCSGRTQGAAVISSHADYRPAAISARHTTAYDEVTRASMQALASAVDSHTDVPPPLGGRSTADRTRTSDRDRTPLHEAVVAQVASGHVERGTSTVRGQCFLGPKGRPSLDPAAANDAIPLSSCSIR